MAVIIEHPAVEGEPDPRMKPCEQCHCNGWVPEVLDTVTLADSRTVPIVARNVCNKCFGNGWVLR